MVIFIILAAVAVLAAVGVVAQRSAVRSALFLLLHFVCLAGLYLLLNAQFVAMVQIIVYAGAIVVLFLFVVMLLGVERAAEPPDLRPYYGLAGALLGVLLLAGVAWALLSVGGGPVPAEAAGGSVREIGTALLTEFAVPFELVSVALLAALVGAIALARRRLS